MREIEKKRESTLDILPAILSLRAITYAERICRDFHLDDVFKSDKEKIELFQLHFAHYCILKKAWIDLEDDDLLPRAVGKMFLLREKFTGKPSKISSLASKLMEMLIKDQKSEVEERVLSGSSNQDKCGLSFSQIQSFANFVSITVLGLGHEDNDRELKDLKPAIEAIKKRYKA